MKPTVNLNVPRCRAAATRSAPGAAGSGAGRPRRRNVDLPLGPIRPGPPSRPLDGRLPETRIADPWRWHQKQLGRGSQKARRTPNDRPVRPIGTGHDRGSGGNGSHEHPVQALAP